MRASFYLACLRKGDSLSFLMFSSIYFIACAHMDALVCMWKPEDNSWELPLFFHAEPGLAGSKAFTR